MFRKLLSKLLYPHSYSSEAYIKFLRKKGAVIGEGTRFIAPRKCNVDVGRAEYITIGKNCCLSLCTILAHDYSWYVFLNSHNKLLPDPGGKVVIGDNCFIGNEACILKDTVIGNNVIIGARAVIKGIIPSNTVWAGVPAKQICTLEELIEKRSNTLEGARKRYHVIQDRYNRKPTIQEMGWFALLFLERNNTNYSKYIKDIEFNGLKDSDKIKDFFGNTQPLYKSYDDFIKDVN